MQHNKRLFIIRSVIINPDFKRTEFSRLSLGRVLINESASFLCDTAKVHTQRHRTTANDSKKNHKYTKDKNDQLR